MDMILLFISFANTFLFSFVINYELDVEPVKTILEDTYVTGWNSWTKNGDKYVGWRYQSLAGTGQIVYGVCEKTNSFLRDQGINNQSIHSDKSPASQAEKNIPTEFWLFSPLYKTDAILSVHLEITYQMKSCLQLGFTHPSIDCREHLDILVYHSDVQSPSMTPNDFSVAHMLSFQQGEPHKNELIISSSLKRATIQIRPNMKWLQIAFRDNGACVLIDRLIAFHLSCPATKFRLVNLPETEAGYNKEIRQVHVQCIPGSIYVYEYPVDDKQNSIINQQNYNKLSSINDRTTGLAFCMADGKWRLQTNHGCVCDAGYELVEHTETCHVCPRGMFKSSPGLQPCSLCPLNSVAPRAGFRMCQCLSGYFRIAPNLSAEHSCLGPPSAPRNLNAIHINGTSVILSWDPPIRSGGFHETLYHVQCQGCQMDTVKYIPGNHLTENKVTITGLNPQTRYQFDVYAHNAVSTRTESMWTNVASVMVTTGSALTYLIADIRTKWLNESTVHINWDVYQVAPATKLPLSSPSSLTSQLLSSNEASESSKSQPSNLSYHLLGSDEQKPDRISVFTNQIRFQLCLFDKVNQKFQTGTPFSNTLYFTTAGNNNNNLQINNTDNYDRVEIDSNIKINRSHSVLQKQQSMTNSSLKVTTYTHGTGLIGNPDALHYTSQSEIILYNLYSESGFFIQIRAQHPNAYCPYSSPIFLLSPKYNRTISATFHDEKHNELPRLSNKITNGTFNIPLQHLAPDTIFNSTSVNKYISPVYIETVENQTSSDRILNWNSESSASKSNSSVITIGLLLSVALTTIISIILLITLIVLCVHRKGSRRKLIQKKWSHITAKMNKYLLFNSSTNNANKNEMQSWMFMDSAEVNIIPCEKIKVMYKLGENRYGQTFFAKLYLHIQPPNSLSVNASYSKLHNVITKNILESPCFPEDNSFENSGAKNEHDWNKKYVNSFEEYEKFDSIHHLKTDEQSKGIFPDEIHRNRDAARLQNTVKHPEFNCVDVFLQDLCHCQITKEKQTQFAYPVGGNKKQQQLGRSRSNIKELLMNRRMVELIQKCTKFNHPNIVKFYGLTMLKLADTISTCSFVNEFCTYGSLDLYLKMILEDDQVQTSDLKLKSFNLCTALKMLFDILSGLEYLSSESFTVENFTGSSVLLDSCYNCKIRIRLTTVLDANEVIKCQKKYQTNKAFFQPLLLNNEFASEDFRRQDEQQRLERTIMNTEFSGSFPYNSKTSINTSYGNVYDIYKNIIDHTKAHKEGLNKLCCQSITSTNLYAASSYLNNIWSFGQLLIEIIVAHLILENKLKFMHFLKNELPYNHGHHFCQSQIQCYHNVCTHGLQVDPRCNLSSITPQHFSYCLTLRPSSPATLTLHHCQDKDQQNQFLKIDEQGKQIDPPKLTSSTGKYLTFPSMKTFAKELNDEISNSCVNNNTNNAVQLKDFNSPCHNHSSEIEKNINNNEDNEILGLFRQLTLEPFISEEVYLDYLCKFLRNLTPQTNLDKVLLTCRHPRIQLRPTFPEIRKQLNYAMQTVTTQSVACKSSRTVVDSHSHIHNHLTGSTEHQNFMTTSQTERITDRLSERI
uniref:Receptor protein-tyrosine kinase n=2 Tax=Trichobilharzia regenti TaxID=157069 RepID=A0AA85JZ00_TRIRE|nr:unnamed protein product [Trichobilharzia regenti]